MSRQISVKPYRRVFRQPLRTAYGEWTTREGFLVRLRQEERTGYGEVAPLPSRVRDRHGHARRGERRAHARVEEPRGAWSAGDPKSAAVASPIGRLWCECVELPLKR